MAQAAAATEFKREFLERVAQNEDAALSIQQMTALREAIQGDEWPGDHPVDLRMSVPFPKRFFFVLVAGRDKRGWRRRQSERMLHPITTPGNKVFLTIFGVVVAALGYIVWDYIHIVAG